MPSVNVDAPLTSTGRKRPCCTKCGKPMFGHKRGQCSAEPTPVKATKLKEEENGEQDLTEQLAELDIGKCDSESEDTAQTKKPDKLAQRKRTSAVSPRMPKTRTQTLESLTSSNKAVLDSLGKPGMMSKDAAFSESAARSQIERWLANVPPTPPTESPKRTYQKRPSGRPPIEASRDFDAMLDLPQKKGNIPRQRSPANPANSAKPLGRTSSPGDREEIFEQLAQKSKRHAASVFAIDMKDVKELEEDAKRLKLHARIIAPKYADGSTGDGWLVVGKEEESVAALFAEVERDVKGGRMGYMARLGHIATGAIIAWTYLAFS